MKYFKKPSGVVIEVNSDHDVNSLKERFAECDANGNAIKEKPKKTASKKKGSK